MYANFHLAAQHGASRTEIIGVQLWHLLNAEVILNFDPTDFVIVSTLAWYKSIFRLVN